LIAQPRAPALNGLPEMRREGVARGVRGKIPQIEGEQERGGEDGGLPEAALRNALGSVAERRGNSEEKQEQEAENLPRETREVQDVPRPRVSDGLRGALGSQRISLRSVRRFAADLCSGRRDPALRRDCALPRFGGLRGAQETAE